ncbi:MAG: exonuclease domain-containing protein [Pseudomonadota bacterium]
MKALRDTAGISALPDHYYLAHFEEMLEFVCAKNPHILDKSQNEFRVAFQQLSLSERCLFVRLVNRRSRIFDSKRLRYPEIPNLQRAVQQLVSRGWLRHVGPEHFEELLGLATRDQLAHALRIDHAGLARTLNKTQYIDFARQHGHRLNLVQQLSTATVFVHKHQSTVEFFLFLYFGKITQGLSRFTQRDLGVLRAPSEQGAHQSRFETRAQALEQFYYARTLGQLTKKACRDRSAVLENLQQWQLGWEQSHSSTREKLILTLAKAYEADAQTDKAIETLTLGRSPSSIRRLVRLMLANDQRELALEHLKACVQDTKDPELLGLAEDLIVRRFRKKKTSDLTDTLRDAACIDLDDAWLGMPERAALEYFERQGCVAYRSENRLWRSFFGVLFWDLLFGDKADASYSPFDALPASLNNGSFASLHANEIEQRCEQLVDHKKTRLLLLKNLSRYHGQENVLFQWTASLAEKLLALNSSTPGSAQGKILKAMTAEFKNNSHGYPDLLVIDNGVGRFIEIKAQGDALKRNQLTRIHQLQAAGFIAEVMRVNWVVNPEQDYVVLDVETTGGRGDQHRVTEIGAVKIRDGQCIDQFETLLNPERRIPPYISRLTGISEAMVAPAPLFSEVADRLEAFLDGAVFVAHNVNFDYGFIKAEFNRIGRPFRHPRLCTCAQMRRYFPGAKSYSLKNLCKRYDIDLNSHHRALCDAQAAAELLCMINEKRQEESLALRSTS